LLNPYASVVQLDYSSSKDLQLIACPDGPHKTENKWVSITEGDELCADAINAGHDVVLGNCCPMFLFKEYDRQIGVTETVPDHE
jgi:hypothetical protein